MLLLGEEKMIGQLCESLGLVGLFMVFIVLVDLGIMKHQQLLIARVMKLKLFDRE